MTTDELDRSSGSADVEELARQIAARLASDALLDARDVGALLKCTPAYVTEDYVRAPGFPKAIRLTGPDGRHSKPRWRRCDIIDWINSHVGGKSKLGGRPRLSPDRF